MVMLDDLCAAVLARTQGAPAFALALPGGAWLDRGPDTPTGAYAIFSFERSGDPEWISDGTYLADFTLRIVAYAPQGATPASTPQAAQQAMAAAINVNPTAWAPLRAGFVNLCLPMGYDGKHDPSLRQGKDVFAAAGQWKMTIEGNLSP
jgi:hypothetical protein